MYYRLSQDIKLLFLKFFQKLFTLYEENKISFVDGRSKIIFAQSPKVAELDAYDFKQYPAILIGLSPGSFRDVSPNKFRAYVNNEYVYGFISTLTVNFIVYALSKEDRNQLADLVCVYLAKQDTKQFFEQRGIRLGMPTFSGDSTEDESQTNVRRFYTSISLSLEADIEDTAQIVDSFGNVGLTVMDVWSLIGDDNEDGENESLWT